MTTTMNFGHSLKELEAKTTKVNVFSPGEWTLMLLDDYRETELGRVELDQCTRIFTTNENDEVEEDRFYH